MDHDQLVAWAHIAGLTSFATLKEFRFDDMISRQEAAKMLMTAIKDVFSKNAPSENILCDASYADKPTIDTTLWPFVSDACEFGLTKGTLIDGKKYFVPMGNLTRAQALAMVMR